MGANIIIDVVMETGQIAPPNMVRLLVSVVKGAKLRVSYAGNIDDTYHRIDKIYSIEEWEDIMSEAGWALGAHYLLRRHFPPDSLYSDGYEYHWEFNSSWRSGILSVWRTKDPSLNEDGLRATPFPGWRRKHSFEHSELKGMVGEWLYFYSCPPTYYNEHIHVLRRGA